MVLSDHYINLYDLCAVHIAAAVFLILKAINGRNRPVSLILEGNSESLYSKVSIRQASSRREQHFFLCGESL